LIPLLSLQQDLSFSFPLQIFTSAHAELCILCGTQWMAATLVPSDVFLLHPCQSHALTISRGLMSKIPLSLYSLSLLLRLWPLVSRHYQANYWPARIPQLAVPSPYFLTCKVPAIEGPTVAFLRLSNVNVPPLTEEPQFEIHSVNPPFVAHISVSRFHNL
jgi:hypothetical protein